MNASALTDQGQLLGGSLGNAASGRKVTAFGITVRGGDGPHGFAITSDNQVLAAYDSPEDRNYRAKIAAALNGRQALDLAVGEHCVLLLVRDTPALAGRTVQATFTRTHHQDKHLTLRLRRPADGIDTTLSTTGEPRTFTGKEREPIQVIVGGLDTPPAPGRLQLAYDPGTNTMSLDTAATQLPHPLTCTSPAPNHLAFTWND
ncbi:hypothetical protein [Streptomyces sp. NPDC046727]|uniref:hypothetical protein n=1 Tax=Streptomyces sp. NPDC046727 TaxID=3155373 RepID=UPI0033DEF39A